MREVRAWLFLGLGLLLAGLTGLSLYGVSLDYGGRGVAAASDAIEVVVARVDIATRAVLTTDMIMRKPFPRTLVPTGAALSESDVLGKTTQSAIPAGAALTQSQLIDAGGRSGASVTLEKGKVLVAFPTTDPLTIAGLVKPGDRIDVLATVTSGTGESSRKTQTMLQNLEVTDVLSTGREGQRVASLTFVVDHQVALVLKHLRDTQAAIDIVVRSRDESEPANTTSVDLGYLVQTYGVRR
ncbi:MAG: Flp pilus assembly protein CpaB [Candidatus Limnocylindria bacterium]